MGGGRREDTRSDRMPQVLLHRGVMEKLLTMDWTTWRYKVIIRILHCSEKKKCVVWLQPGFREKKIISGKRPLLKEHFIAFCYDNLGCYYLGIVFSHESWADFTWTIIITVHCKLVKHNITWVTVLLPYPQKHWILTSRLLSLKLLLPFYSDP